MTYAETLMERFGIINVPEALDKMIEEPDKYFQSWFEMFGMLCMFCALTEHHLSFEYYTGWYVRADTEEKYHDHTRAGYTIEVGGFATARDDGLSVFYDDPQTAIYAGLQLLAVAIKEDTQGE